MKSIPKIRFLLAWGNRRKGDVVQPQSEWEMKMLNSLAFYGQKVAELVQEPRAELPVQCRIPLVLDPIAAAFAETPVSLDSPPEEPAPKFGKGKKRFQ